MNCYNVCNVFLNRCYKYLEMSFFDEIVVPPLGTNSSLNFIVIVILWIFQGTLSKKRRAQVFKLPISQMKNTWADTLFEIKCEKSSR